MKHTAKLTVAGLLLAALTFSSFLSVTAADKFKLEIEEKDVSESVYSYLFDFEKDAVRGAEGDTRGISFGPSIGIGKTAKWAFEKKIEYAPGDDIMLDEENKLIDSNPLDTEVPGNESKALSYTYYPGAQKYREAEVRIAPADLIRRTEIANGTFSRTNVDFDFIRFDFDLYLEKTETNFYLRLKNTPEAILMLIEPQRNQEGALTDIYDIYLRDANGGIATTVDKQNDKKLGTVRSGEWNTYSVTFYPLRDRIGYYDFSISLNGTELSDEGTMYYMPSIVDDAALTYDATKLTLGMEAVFGTLSEKMVWAVDNIGFELFKYKIEPVFTAPVPTVTEIQNDTFTLLWSSSDISSDAVFNIRPAMTLMNSNRALQFNGVAGSGADLPQWQVKGGYTSSDFSVVASDNGTVSVTKAAGGTVTLPLYGGNLGNANISGVIGDDYKICFAVENALENPVTLTLNGTSLNLPAFTSGINEVAIVVTGGTSASVSVGDGEAVTTTITKKTAQETPTLVIGLSDNRETVFSGFSVSEKRTIKTYYIDNGSTPVEISGVIANYLQYRKAKAEAANPETVKPTEYETLDRRAVRPVTAGVQFDSATFYYDPESKIIVNDWGSSINNQWTTEVTYWSRTRVIPETQKDENGNVLKDADGNDLIVEGSDTNTYNKGYASIWLEDGAVITRMNKSTDPENGWEYTAGFQANLSKADVRTMLRDFASDYFRYTFSIWYDEVTFAHGEENGNERNFVLRLGNSGTGGEHAVGNFGLRGQIVLTIDGEGKLTVPKSAVGESGTTLGYGTNLVDNGNGTYTLTTMNEDVTYQLDNGWNTIEMIYRYKTSEVKTEEVSGVKNQETVTETKDVAHHYFEVGLTVNGDRLSYENADPTDTTPFLFDNGINPTTAKVFFEGIAKLHSDGTEQATELMQLKVKDFKYEFVRDEEIDVNCYIKGTFGDEVLAYSDFFGVPCILDESEKARYEHYSEPSVYANATDAVSFVNENDKLKVTHKTAESHAVTGYFYENDILCGKALTFDVSLYHNGNLPDEIAVMADGVKLFSVDADGAIFFGTRNISLLEQGTWNRLSAVLEVIEETTCLTIYLQGEIVLFRAEVTLGEVRSVSIVSDGSAGAFYKLDDIALAQDYIPTSIVYMMPVVYRYEGELSGGSYEQYHVIGTESTLFPTAGKEGATFDGWYFDDTFVTRAVRIKESYCKPVVLYARYNYRVSYDGYSFGNDKTTYGDITLPSPEGVFYWHTNLSGQDYYFVPGSVFHVVSRTVFDALDETEAKNIDFILSVRQIALDASDNLSMNYRDILNLIEGVTDDTETKDIDETVIGINQYYTEADKTDAGVIAAKAKLDVIKEKMQDKLDAAAAYLAEFDILFDKSKSYAERYASYEKLNVTKDADGKTWRQRVDSTCPGVFAANNELVVYRLTLDRAAKAAVELAVACSGASGSTFEEKYFFIQEIYNAYNNCKTKTDIELVRTYVFTSDDFAGTSVTSPKTSAEYLTSAKQKIDGYHTTVSAYNGEIYSAQAAVNAVVYKAKPVVCIKEVLNRFKEAIAFKHDED